MGEKVSQYPMEYILSDFVNRTELIDLMWQMTREEIETRILVVEGMGGSGKSYLIKEFQAECQEENLHVVRLDFADRYENPGYLYIVKEIWSQLGMEGFQSLADAVREITNRALQVQVPAGFQDQQIRAQASPSILPPDESVMRLPNSTPKNGGGASEQSGGVNISGGTNVFKGDIAGRDIIHLIQIIQREDPFVHVQAQFAITDALRQCLMQVAQEQKISILIDHWQDADRETRRWLGGSLVKWVADALLPKISVVIAGQEVDDLDPRRRIKKAYLSELTEDAAHRYLVEKCGLPEGEVGEVIHVTGGFPLMLVMAAARRRRLAAP